MGVIIDEHLTWKEHVNEIGSKAIRAKAFLQRNFFRSPTQVKSNCYTSLVWLILEYASTVWSPHLQYQIQQLEKVQRSVARFVTNDFSCYSNVTSMLDQLQWPLDKQRRCFSKLIMFYKILHGLVDINLVLTPLATFTHGHNDRFTIPFARTDTCLIFFLPSTIKLWNSLPNYLTNFEDISQFKDELFLHVFP